MALLSQILASPRGSSTKKEGIITGVIGCISDNTLKIGDALPSVNELAKGLGYSRETVVQSYQELKDRGIIESKHGVGFFVVNQNVELKQSIVLVLYEFLTFQQEFYSEFRKTLGEDYNIEVYFHHNNLAVFESILKSVIGKYGTYVIAPIQSADVDLLLEPFPSGKLLIIDRYQFVNEQVSKITQEFKQSLLVVFDDLLSEILTYKKIILFFQEDVAYPPEILWAVREFCDKHKLKLEIQKEYTSGILRKGYLYFTIGDGDLWHLLKEAKTKKLKAGVDFGILSHNDSPVKEIIEGGITTFSTDFRRMGKEAARFILNKQFVNTIIPSELIKRNSL